MKKKTLHRIFASLSAAVLSVGVVAACTGCTTNNPEVTITYTFNGKDYEVDYILSRKSGPQTTQHFIELADKGYYDGLVIHDYETDALYGGGYTYDTTTKKLTEKDYFTTVKDWGLTQSVFIKDSENKYVGTNTLYGEFSGNAVSLADKLKHEKGSLVMYYSSKGASAERVSTIRNQDNTIQDSKEYKYNSATSLFYTYLGSANSVLDNSYCVFGKTKNYDEQMSGDDGLLTAISEYRKENTGFTEITTVYPNLNDPYFESVRVDKVSATYDVPTQPIVIKSVKVTRY